MTAVLGTHSRDWHTERLDGIGGSDAPVVVGLSPYKRPIELYREKRDRIIPDETVDVPLRMRLGNMIEGLVLDLYDEQTGRKTRHISSTRWSKAYPWAYVHLDGQVVGEKRIVQVKTAGQHSRREEWGEPGEGPTKGVPADIYVQELHELAVTGADVADVVLLRGFESLTIYELPRDDVSIDLLMKEEAQFVEDVRKGIEPAIDGSEAYRRHISEKFPRDQGVVRLATPEEDVLISNLDLTLHNLKMVEENAETMKNRLREIIGDDAGITGSAGTVTWKAQGSKRTDWKTVAGAYRALLDLYRGQFGDELGDEKVRLILGDLDTFENIHTTESTSRVLRTKFAKEKE